MAGRSQPDRHVWKTSFGLTMRCGHARVKVRPRSRSSPRQDCRDRQMRARRFPSDAHPSRLGRADLGDTWMLDQDGRWIWGASTGSGQQGSQQAEAAAAAWHQKRISGLGRLDWCGAFDQDLDLPRTMTKRALQPLAMCPPCEPIGQGSYTVAQDRRRTERQVSMC